MRGVVSTPYVNKSGKDEERTHCSRLETETQLTVNPSSRPRERALDGNPEIDAVFVGSMYQPSELVAVGAPSGRIEGPERVEDKSPAQATCGGSVC